MTVEEAIEALSLLRVFDAPHLDEAVKMAVSALRAQQTPAQLDRRRWCGCETCKGGRYRSGEYCPGCGRPLTEEAWDELERRINGGTADDEK